MSRNILTSAADKKNAAASAAAAAAAAANASSSASPATPQRPLSSPPALSLTLLHTRAVGVDFNQSANHNNTITVESNTECDERVQSLWKSMQELRTRFPLASAHLSPLIDLVPASTNPPIPDGRILVVAEAATRSVQQHALEWWGISMNNILFKNPLHSVLKSHSLFDVFVLNDLNSGSSLPLLRAISHSTLTALDALNRTGIFHKFWHLLDIGFDTHSYLKLHHTFVNNIARFPSPIALKQMFEHPVMIPPEVLLAGPQSMLETNSSLSPILLKSDVYAFAMLLLRLIRGSFPVPPRRKKTDTLSEYGSSPIADEIVDEADVVEEVWKVIFQETRVEDLASSQNQQQEQQHRIPEEEDDGEHEQHDSDASQKEDQQKQKNQHSACHLCNPTAQFEDAIPPPSSSAGKQQSNGTTIDVEKGRTASLCIACWLDLSNLAPGFVSTTSLPLSLLSSSLVGASASYQSAYASFLDMLRLMMDANPVSRPTANEALQHPFFSLTAKWGVLATRQRNVQQKWKVKTVGAVVAGGETAQGVARLNSSHTELNQIALDPIFRMSGFKSVEASGISSGAGLATAAATCPLCHQPLPPAAEVHPSSPAACHCLLDYSGADLYQVWTNALASQGVSLYEWLENQFSSSQKNEDTIDLMEPLVKRSNLTLESFPTMSLSRDTLNRLHGGSEGAGEISSTAPFLSLPLHIPSTQSPQVFYVPLLPLYHLVKNSILENHNKEIQRLWKELEIVDKELEENEKTNAAAQAKKEKVVRMKKSSSSTETSLAPGLVPTATVPSTLSPFAASLYRSIEALVEIKRGAKLYPASQSKLVRAARNTFHAHYEWFSSASVVPTLSDGSAPTKKWKVFANGATEGGKVWSHQLRAQLYPILLSVSAASLLSYQVHCELNVENMSLHAEVEQLAKDCSRLQSLSPSFNDPSSLTRLQRLLTVFLNQHRPCIYWQGMHEIAATVLLLYPAPAQESMAYAVFESIMAKKFLKELFVQDNSQALLRQCQQIEQVLYEVDPVLAQYLLEKLEIHWSQFIFSWLLTAYAHVLSVDSTHAIWDALLLAGAVETQGESALAASSELSRAAREEYQIWILIPVAALHLLRGYILPVALQGMVPSAGSAPAAVATLSNAPSFQDVLFELTHSMHTIDSHEWIQMIGVLRREITEKVWDNIQM